MLEESLEIFTALSHQSGTAWTLAFLGQMAADEGHFGLARERLGQSLEVSRRLGSRADVRAMLHSLSKIALQESDWEQARVFLRELLGQAAPDTNSFPPRGVLRDFARLAAGQGQMERAARLWGAAGEDAMQDSQFTASEFTASEFTALAREILGESAFGSACERGAALSPTEVTQEALAV